MIRKSNIFLKFGKDTVVKRKRIEFLLLYNNIWGSGIKLIVAH